MNTALVIPGTTAPKFTPTAAVGVNVTAAEMAVAVPLTAMVTFVVPSVVRTSVSFSTVPVGVEIVGLKVTVIVHDAPGSSTKTPAAGRHPPAPAPWALKSGDAVVFTPVNAMGPSPVFVKMTGPNAPPLPCAIGVGKVTDVPAGDGVPGGAVSVCPRNTCGWLEPEPWPDDD